MPGEKVFVGFGFGAIQSGLFLYEAHRSGNFRELVVAEVLEDLVDAVRKANGEITVNIAYADHIEKARFGGVDIRDPNNQNEQEFLIEAISRADAISTAVPSVDHYTNENPGSIHALIARGLAEKTRQSGPACVVYTAENHNHAAEILDEAVMGYAESHGLEIDPEKAQFLNTVIGKMSQVVSGEDEIRRRRLEPVTPGSARAFLVEVYNRIQISQVTLAGYARGIEIFEEKSDLYPFEEAKLFGHNAIHAVLGFLAARRGIEWMDALAQHADLLDLAERAFKEEVGTALLKKYAGRDALFTREGFDAYASDLLKRMVNPMLHDATSRVTRDVERKLGWDDRIIGSMRCCLENGVDPKRLAFSALAALAATCDNVGEDLHGAIQALRDRWILDGISREDADQLAGILKRMCGAFLGWSADVSRDPGEWIS